MTNYTIIGENPSINKPINLSIKYTPKGDKYEIEVISNGEIVEQKELMKLIDGVV